MALLALYIALMLIYDPVICDDYLVMQFPPLLTPLLDVQMM